MSDKLARPPEIEITPEMIEAGVLALVSFDSRFESEEDAVVSIFEAMLSAMGAVPRQAE